MIPPRLIHIWGTPSRQPEVRPARPLPLAAQASAQNARLLHPAYEYCFFDDAAIAAFLDAEFPQYRTAFSQFPLPIQRFDFFRYLVIYRRGGFYLDLDVYLAKPLDDLRAHAAVFPFEELTLSSYLRQDLQHDWELGNYAFGAEAGHPFLAAIIENCLRALTDPTWAQRMYADIPQAFRAQFIATNTTGPGLVTRTLAENPALATSLAVLFPDDVCHPDTWHRFGDYGAHLMSSSWRTPDNIWRRRLARWWEARRRRHGEYCSRTRGPLRPGPWGSRFPSPTESR